MNTDIQIFDSEEFGKIRTAGTPENPLFCLVDLCKVLSLDSKKVRRRLEGGTLVRHPLSTTGGKQQGNFVTEDGLYDVILDSRKPEARKFRKWVTGEVLPAIRKRGQYAVSDGVSARALQLEQEVGDARLAMSELEREVGRYERVVSALSAMKKDYERQTLVQADMISSLTTGFSRRDLRELVTTTQAALMLGMDAWQLNDLLEKESVIFRDVLGIHLCRPYDDAGLASERVYSASGSVFGDGKTYLMWTRAGRQFLLSLKAAGFKDARAVLEIVLNDW